MGSIFVVMAGGALGAAMRYLLTSLAGWVFGHGFPAGTMLANIIGSFAMGLLIGALALRSGTDPQIRLFLATGFLGGFTTFSAFSLDAVTLYERGQLAAAALYVGGSVVISIAALFMGLHAMRSVG
ncbi:MAG: fluoride efflux transporter CrcB [Hyphomicrobiaceae bacterium]|nr:fluoride efflux transporter CrcB [Hyphomicrobiaceae bacterium]